jgi:toxin FitB
MSGYLVDTNVVSEVRKGARCNPGVRAWYDSVPTEQLLITAITFGELLRGIHLVRRNDPQQATVLDAWYRQLKVLFANKVIAVDLTVMERWAEISAARTIAPLDGIIAATAITKDLIVVTRNISDFTPTGAQVLNPFS